MQFIGIRWPERVDPHRAGFGRRVLNMPWRLFLSMVLAAVRGWLSVGYPGVARLGPQVLTPSPPRKGMPKRGLHV